MLRFDAIERIVGSAPIRWAANAGFARYAAHRVASLDRMPAAKRQADTLLKLVRAARNTTFGREHNFAAIGSIAEYQRRVPLRHYEDFWTEYWQPAFPSLRDATWPGQLPYIALSSGTTSGATKYIPVSRAMMRSNRRAAFTALAWFEAAHPGSRLFSGRTLFLGGSTDLKPAGAGYSERSAPLMGDLSGIAAHDFPKIMRPFAFPPLELAIASDWEFKLARVAELSAQLPITAISGVPSWLLTFFEELRRVTGRETIAKIWPTLKLVIYGGTRFDPYRALFERIVGGTGVHFLETYPASEGFVAAEDPRFQQLRLIPDHGVFYEFVPVDELQRERPTRHTLADICPGIQYAVVLTTCAGLWSYVLGDTVCFDRVSPPLLRFTGRTQQYLSAFGEHLIGDEVERAVTHAALETGTAVIDFHVGPAFPSKAGEIGHHRYFVEFATLPRSTNRFAMEIDAALSRYNEDYSAHRAKDLTLRMPEVIPVSPGSFAKWMRSRGKFGGQHKVPRMDNSGRITENLAGWLQTESKRELPRSA